MVQFAIWICQEFLSNISGESSLKAQAPEVISGDPLGDPLASST